MFFRQKRVENRTYLQIVENHRDGAKTRQKVLLTLGRLEDLYEKDRFDKLIQSGARFSQQLMMLSALKEGSLDRIATRRIGPPLLFGTPLGNHQHQDGDRWPTQGSGRSSFRSNGRCSRRCCIA